MKHVEIHSVLGKGLLWISLFLVSVAVQAQQGSSIVVKAAPNTNISYWNIDADRFADNELNVTSATKAKTDSLGYFQRTFPAERSGVLVLWPLGKGVMKTLGVRLTPGSLDTIIVEKEKIGFRGTNADYNRCLERVENYLSFTDSLVAIRSSLNELARTPSVSVFRKILEERKSEAENFIRKAGVDKVFAGEQYAHLDMACRFAFMNKFLHMLPDSLLTDEWRNTLKQIVYKPVTASYFRSYREMSLFLPSLSASLYKLETGGLKDYKYDKGFGILEKTLSGEDLEFAWAHFLFTDIVGRGNRQEIPVMYEQFRKRFPDSRYITFLEPGIKENIRFNNPDSLVIEEDKYHMLTCGEDIRNLQDVLEQFRGKLVYIDIWATTCGSCKEVFPFMPALKEKTKDMKDIVYLYISLDNDKRHEEWQKSVLYYDLEGYNLRANDRLADYIRENISAWIPRFMIADKKGKVVVKSAPSPEEAGQVYDLLVKYNK